MIVLWIAVTMRLFQLLYLNFVPGFWAAPDFRKLQPMNLETFTLFFCLYSMDGNSPSGKVTDTDSIAMDAELVKRCQNGDRKAFNELMLKHQKRVFNIMYRFCGEYEEAKDLTQDVFVKVFRSLHSLKEERKLKSWIIAIATNTFRNRYKYMKSRGKGRTDSIDCPKETEEGSMKRELKDSSPGADEMTHQARVREVVQNKIALLKDDYKEVIILRDIEGLSYDEVSSALNISIGTVKSRIFRAREELKGHLSGIIDTL